MKSISINGRSLNIYHITGNVSGHQKHTTTQVYGGGSVSQGAGSVSVHSTNTIHNDIFLTDDAGTEHSVQLRHFDVACKEGQRLTVVWAIPNGKKEGPYLFVYNHDTRQEFYPMEATLLKVMGYGNSQLVRGCMGVLAGLAVLFIAVYVMTSGPMLRLPPSVRKNGILIGLAIHGILVGGIVLHFVKKAKMKRDLSRLQNEVRSVL